MSTELQKAGQAEIKEISLCVLDKTGVKQVEPLLDMVAQITLIQDLFEGPMTCTVVLSDSKGSLTRFNKRGFQGQEFLSLRVSKPGENFTFSQQFWIYDVTDIEFNETNDTSSMTLNCISKEKIIDVYASVNKAYDSTYSQVAKSIFENKIRDSDIGKKYFINHGDVNFSTPQINVHESPVQNKFIIPGKQPFEAIEFCMRRCVGREGTNNTSGNFFTFYETFEGYNFHNVENLIDSGVAIVEADKNNDTHFELAPLSDKVENKNFDRKIKELQNIKTSNNLENANGGVLNNKVRNIDLIGKTYNDISFDYKTKFNSFRHLGTEPIIDDDYIEMFTRPVYEHLMLKDTTKENQFYEYVVGHRMPYISSLHNLQCGFTIDGDFQRKPGEVLNLSVPEISAVGGVDRFETKFSGNWLVQRVVHVFNKQQHSTSISLLKDSLISAIGE